MKAETMQAELEQDGAQQLLCRGPLARVAYLGVDGTPRLVPVGFHWNGYAVIFCTATRAPKVAALSANPAVALSIEPDDASRTLQLRGEAEITVVDGIPDEYLAASSKTMEPEQREEFAQNVRQMYPQMARIAVTPTWARYYDFSAGRMPAFLAQMAAEAQARG